MRLIDVLRRQTEDLGWQQPWYVKLGYACGWEDCIEGD